VYIKLWEEGKKESEEKGRVYDQVFSFTKILSFLKASS